MRDSWRLMAAAIGIGALAGLRTMTAPAVVSWATERGWIRSPGRHLAFLGNKRTVAIISTLAAGELAVDKLPATPNRTLPAGLVARFVSGGLSAGVLCASKKKMVAPGVLLGGLAAIAGAFIGYTARRELREKLHLSDAAIAVAEDALAAGGGVLLVHSL